MKRPLALIGFTMLLVLTVCFYSKPDVAFAVFIISALGVAFTLLIKKLRKMVSPTVFFATALSVSAVFTLFTQLYVAPLQQRYDGVTCDVTATVCDEGYYYRGIYFYEIKAESINGEKVSFKLSLSSSDALMCQVDDKVSFTAELQSAYYGGYLSDRMYISAGIYSEDEVTVIPTESRSLYYYAVSLRSALRSAFYLEQDYDVAAFSTAVLLGDDSGFSEEMYQSLRYAGMSHIVVVSGLHLSVITMLYRKLFGKLIKNKYVNTLCTVAIVMFFLCLTGFGKSSIRAAIMLFAVLLSGLFSRESDSLNSLGLAAVLLCAFNPYVVGDVGVLLSFSATFGIVVFSQKLEDFLTKGLKPVEDARFKHFNKFLRYMAGILACTVTAALATLPVTIIFFGRVSLVQIISNFLAAPLIQYFMMFSALCAVFHFVPYLGFISDVFAVLTNVVGGIILWIARVFAALPMSYVQADYTFVLFWVFATITLCVVAYILRQGKGVTLLCVFLSLLILISGSVGHYLCYKNVCSLYIAPAKNGQSIVISSRDGNAVLSCSGSNAYRITDLLDTLYSDSQLMVVASRDNTASKNARYISELFDYKTVLMYDTDDSSEHAEYLRNNADSFNLVYDDYVINLWDKATLSIIERQGNVYQYLVCGNTKVLILPPYGDASEIPEDMRSPDVLVTSGMIENMELLSFNALFANGGDFESAAVIDFYRNREGSKTSVSDTVTLDIVS